MMREHETRLMGKDMVLRPMTEGDWDVLYRWNNDPEVLYWSEGDAVDSRSLEDVRRIYRGMSRTAFMFIGELEGLPVAECWLQEMNLPRLSALYPGLDLRRIDLAIGEKELWGQGLGTEIIGLLTRFAFLEQQADLVFGCEIGGSNAFSLGAFAKNGYVQALRQAGELGGKWRWLIDVAISRKEWTRNVQGR